jgi:hypothetical protein
MEKIMKIICLFAQRKEAYPGEYAPELLSAIDDVGDTDNPDYMLEEQEKARKDEELAFFRRMEISVNEKEFNDLFYGTALKGTVKSA